MKTLFLDLASHSGLLACVADDAVVASVSVDHRINDTELVPLFEKLLKDANWMQQDIQRIACVIGPGGFTSLRVAVAFANALAFGLDVPVAGVHLSDLWAARTPPIPRPLSPVSGERGGAEPRAISHLPEGGRGLGGGGFLWLHSTKKTQLFVRGFGSWAQKFPEAVCISLDDLLQVLPSPQRGEGQGVGAVWLGELLPEHEALVAAKGGKRADAQPPLEILPQFVSALMYEKKTLVPWYGRSW